MDSERLGLNPEQQSQIDDVFLDTTLAALTNQKHYWERAALVSLGDVAQELEGIHTRTFEQANMALVKNEEVNVTVRALLAKLAFIDALALPSAEEVNKREKVARALGDYKHHRRLFAGLAYTQDQ
jgi:hypothetical protein